MDYFCYISRTKVDQFFQSLSAGVDEWTEKQITEHDVGGEVGADFSIAGILKLFKGGISYGRKGVIQREKKVKLHYVDKLRKVLLALAKEKPIPNLEDAVKSSVFDSIYWHYQGDFKVQDPVSRFASELAASQVVRLQSRVGPAQLNLDCSLRFFSEGNEPDGSFLLHSSNTSFFSGDISLHLETVIVLLSHKDNNLVGSPLFLKLSSDEYPYISI